MKPYIASFPPSRTKWVEDIVSGKTESEKVLHRDDSGPIGYLIIPDMKWDLETVSSLYLMALSTTDGVKSLRDLRRSHIPSLKSIIKEGNRVVQEKWGLRQGSLRFYIHYQPSYCEFWGFLCDQYLTPDRDHFHVHIVHAGLQMGMGMLVGQAHLVEDVISLVCQIHVFVGVLISNFMLAGT